MSNSKEGNQYLIAHDIPGLLQTMYYFSLHYFFRNPNLYFIVNKGTYNCQSYIIKKNMFGHRAFNGIINKYMAFIPKFSKRIFYEISHS